MRSNEKIKAARKAAKITQAELAKKLHVCTVAFARCERGEYGLSVDRLMEIAEILGVSPAELLPDEDWTGRKYEVYDAQKN